MKFLRSLGIVALVVIAFVAIATVVLLQQGISARSAPTRTERVVARSLRHFAIPGRERERRNPVAPSAEIIRAGMEHFADHCATCHGNDGKGETEIGRNLYPRAPDMTSRDTQSLTDGELFYIIRNGVRLTGMPAWGEGKGDDEENWHLVAFIRHLPKITLQELDEMKRLNPVTPSEMMEQMEEEKFLQGGETEGATATAPHHHHH